MELMESTSCVKKDELEKFYSIYNKTPPTAVNEQSKKGNPHKLYSTKKVSAV